MLCQLSYVESLWETSRGATAAARKCDCGRIRTYAANAMRFLDAPLNHSGTQSRASAPRGTTLGTHIRGGNRTRDLRIISTML